MLKQANLSFSVAAQSFGDDVTSIQFSTQDKNTAKLIFTIKEGKLPLNLTDAEGIVDLVMGDKSIFEDNKATVTAPLDGKLEYTITADQIRHPGRARGELQLIGKDGKSIGGFRFNFTIKKALVDEYAGPVKEYYVQDLEAIKAEIRKTADSIKELDIVRIDSKLDELEQRVEEGGVGVDEQARQEIEGLTEQLADTLTFETFYRKPKTGKKIVFVGDSTTGVAPALFTRMDIYTKTGGILEGASVLNRGVSGQTLYDFVTKNVTYDLNDVIADQGDLYVLSYGINDIRAGENSPGRTAAQIKQDLKTTIDRLLEQTTGYILLRTPNPFLSSDGGNTGWVVPLNNSQLYSTQLYEIYESFRGYDNRVDIIDIPSLVFGKEAKPSHPLMKDLLHPNDNGYIRIADEIASHISKSNKLPGIQYDYDIIGKGSLVNYTDSKITLVSNSQMNLQKGDVLFVGNSTSVIVTDNVPPSPLQTVSYNGEDLSKHGVVYVGRKKQAEEMRTTNTSKNDWIKVINQEGAGESTSHIVSVIDLQGYGITGINLINLMMDYYVDDRSISKIKFSFWLNNNAAPQSITGGVNVHSSELGIQYDEKIKASFSGSVNFNGFRYLHIVPWFTTSDNTDITLEMGNFSLKIGDKEINLNGLEWQGYNSGAGSKIVKITERNLLMTTDYYETVRNGLSSIGKRRNWSRAVATKTASAELLSLVATVDISSLGITTSAFEIEYSYLTSSSIADIHYPRLWFNNTSTTLSGGTNVLFPLQTTSVSKDVKTRHKDRVSFTPGANSFMHININVKVNAAGNLIFDFGDVVLKIDGTPVNIDTWRIHSPGTSDKMILNCFDGEINMNYKDLLDELMYRNLI